MLTAEDPRQKFTQYTYYTCTTGYQCGELETVTDALGHVTTYNTYDANGRPLTITDPNRTLTTLTYDPRGRLTSRTVVGETTSFSYYPTGLLEQITLPDGSSLSYTYDPAHRLTQVSDGLRN
jgi:YD repeat-containing protein